jgi:hypothetical protein
MLSPPQCNNQSFTSIKLTWMNCVISSTGLTPFDKCVAVVIMNRINEHTRDWKLSDETIAALMGRPGAIRSVKRARKRLHAAGWIGWKRTRDANVYFLCHENTMAAMDEIKQGQMARRERRNETRGDSRVTLQSDTRVTLTHSKYTHEKKKSLQERGLSQEKESAHAVSSELRLMRVVGGGR